MTTTTEQLEANKKLARDYIDQVFNQHNPSKAADFVTGGVVWHGNSLGDIAGAENLAGPAGDVHRGTASGVHRRDLPPRLQQLRLAGELAEVRAPAGALATSAGRYPRPRDV